MKPLTRWQMYRMVRNMGLTRRQTIKAWRIARRESKHLKKSLDKPTALEVQLEHESEQSTA